MSNQPAASSSGNQTLSKARSAKQDEFYTQLGDIEKELKHYRTQLRGKVVLCNCDDPYESNFFRYFALNFNALGLKKLIATSYAKSAIVGGYLPLFDIEGLKPECKEPYAIEINEVPDHNGDGATDLADVEYLLRNDANTSRTLLGDTEYGAGDFRSTECVEYLNQADVVVTNPPFSLFREYVAKLFEFRKSFIILGNVNAATYKEIFSLIKRNKMWLGESIHSGDREFRVPAHYPLEAAGFRVDDDGVKYIRVKGVRWFTNLDVPQRHQEIPLYKNYTADEFPHYDNYDAIEVSKTAEIPADYFGAMGVPITFLDKYNPYQFEIMGITDRDNNSGLKVKEYTEAEVAKPGDLNRRGVIKRGNEYRGTYARLLIKRKQ